MLEGRLNEFKLGDVFQLLAWTGKSGSLTVDAGERTGRVDFHGGRVAFALSDVHRSELAARLANAGLIAEGALPRVVDAQQHGGGRVAEVLLAEGLDDEVVEERLREHIRDAVFTLLRTADGGFRFSPTEADADAGGPVLDTEGLIAEGAARLEEWEQVRQRIPSPDAVLAMAPDPAGEDGRVTVSVDQWRLLVLIDGSRTVAELVELTPQGEYETSQVLAGLAEAGLVEAIDPADGDTALAALVARRDALRRIERSELSQPAPPQTLPDAGTVVPTAGEGDGDGPVGFALVPDREQPVDDALDWVDGPLAEPAQPQPGAPVELWPGDDARPEPDDVVPEPFEEAPEEVVDTPAEAFEDGPEPIADALAEAFEKQPDGRVGAPWEAPGQPEEAAGTHGTDEPGPPAADPAPQAGISALAPAGGPASRGGVDRAQVARELASLGLEGPPAASPPTTDGPPRRLTRDEDVTRGLLVRLMDGVRKA